jgi:hypothetical protein
MARLCLALFMAILFVGKAQSSSTGIHIFDTASEDYRRFAKSAAAGDRSEFTNRMLKYAVNGEASAVFTLYNWGETNEEKRHRMDCLLKVNPDNFPAKVYLSKALIDLNDRGCLTLCREVEAAQRPITDMDFWYNYAAAILEFEEETDPNLRKMWQLMQDWPYAKEGEENIRACATIYHNIISSAVEKKFTDLVCDLWEWCQEKKDPLISNVIWDGIKDTPYLDVVSRRFRTRIARVDASKVSSMADFKKATLEAMEQTVKRKVQQEADLKEQANAIVHGKIQSVLQQAAVRNIPRDPKNAQVFKGFNVADPSDQHIWHWAHRIVSMKREELISFPDRDVVLQDYIKLLDNATLHKFCIDALESLYRLDGESSDEEELN